MLPRARGRSQSQRRPSRSRSASKARGPSIAASTAVADRTVVVAVCEGRGRRIGIASMDFERPTELRVFHLEDGPAYSQLLALLHLLEPESILVPAGSERATPLVSAIESKFRSTSTPTATVPRRAFTADVADTVVPVCGDTAAAVRLTEALCPPPPPPPLCARAHVRGAPCVACAATARAGGHRIALDGLHACGACGACDAGAGVAGSRDAAGCCERRCRASPT